jgi:hypothetical protein
MYLDELKDELSEGMGIDVSVSAIFRALQKAGLTMKKVLYSLYAFCATVLMRLLR